MGRVRSSTVPKCVYNDEEACSRIHEQNWYIPTYLGTMASAFPTTLAFQLPFSAIPSSLGSYLTLTFKILFRTGVCVWGQVPRGEGGGVENGCPANNLTEAPPKLYIQVTLQLIFRCSLPFVCENKGPLSSSKSHDHPEIDFDPARFLDMVTGVLVSYPTSECMWELASLQRDV